MVYLVIAYGGEFEPWECNLIASTNKEKCESYIRERKLKDEYNVKVAGRWKKASDFTVEEIEEI